MVIIFGIEASFDLACPGLINIGVNACLRFSYIG